ncbi:MAG: YHS domain-containing protein [Calditrichaeota bacterium]|nr:MAG: YHS domain-containing protein [Calditrichota bacterium]MBL1207222.1 YHS domain-containing protein [Calditrichota bacterium]NOG47055.1 YHS domain-containing protein [Calditrichota bacterium]
MKKQTIHIDPVCGKKINHNKAHIVITYKKTDYYLCCPKCQSEFEKTPEKFIK